MSHKRKILEGAASNLIRVTLSMLVALTLPPFMVHRLSPAEYSAWVLILQTSTYINLLDLGLQTAISKFVAEYEAKNDVEASSKVFSSSIAILSVAALFGAGIVGMIAWKVPQIFQQMPSYLVGSMRDGILLIGFSTVLALPCTAFLAAFIGLQRYGFPTILAISSKALSTLSLVVLMMLHGTLVQLAAALALFNIATAGVQILGWNRQLRHRIKCSLRFIDRGFSLRLAKYSGALSLWTVASLFVSGLDMVIVGHYDYKNAGYYGVATAAINFLLLVTTSLFSPLLPAVSSLQFERTPEEIGKITINATRLCTLLLCMVGLPLFFVAYPLLRIWVGSDYAVHSAAFLQALVLGNVVRQFGYPYSLVLLATGRQHLASIAATAEAVVNVSVSIYLVKRLGAIGVALGTLVGAFVSIGVHWTISMQLTRSTALLSRRQFLTSGLLRPLTCIIPSLAFLPFWLKLSAAGTFGGVEWLWSAVWCLATLTTAWLIGLTADEKRQIVRTLSKHAPILAHLQR